MSEKIYFCERHDADLEGRVSHLQGNVVETIVERIQSKLKKDYGTHDDVALVVRDTSPVSWDWGDVVDQIRDALELERTPYRAGIWIISFLKDQIYRVS